MNLRSSSNPRRQRSLSASTHNLRPKPSKGRSSGSSAPISPPASPRRSASPAPTVTKPMRPLTAYHIFFQIEREYIIQSTAGPDADKSIYANKSYLPDVPRRYRSTMLQRDWYAGPGKRQKRKHRKSHGKIGFLELSRVISKRWATLDSTDPETKRYVTRIANRELAEYKVEMEEYKEALNGAAASEKTVEQPVPSAVVDGAVGAMISPRDAPSPFSSHEVISPNVTSPLLQHSEPMPPLPPLTGLDNASASFDDFGEIDYSICSMDRSGHYLPSTGPVVDYVKSSIYDPLFELDDRRCVSPTSTDASANAIVDDDLLRLLP